jgi:citronellol/citronellal dehydrogenase
MSYQSVFRPDLFAGQVQVVTGGGSGIGRCIAHELASLGAHVVLIGRRVEKLEAVAAEIAEDGGSVDCWAVDIRDEAAVERVVGEILARHDRIDGLINNAGGQYTSDLEDISKKGWEAVVATNLTGGFLMSREVYRQCMKESGGAIVNIIADMWRSMVEMGHSGAARAGMLNLTWTAAAEWGPAGVRVNAVAPGWVISSGFDAYDDPEFSARFRRLHEFTPLKRLGSEAECAAAVTFLQSPAAGFISGACIRVDGGAPNVATHVPIREGIGAGPAFDGFHRAITPSVLTEDDPPE